MMLCYFVSNSCEAIIGAVCVRYFVSGPIRFDNVRGTAIFCIFGALAGPFLSSFLDAGFVKLNHWGTGQYWEIWQIRFFSNVLTALTFAPAILVWFARPVARRKPFTRWKEACLLFILLLGLCYAALYHEVPPADPVLYCGLVLLLLWAALRLGARGTLSATLVISFLTIWSAAHGHGPFTAHTPEENARSIQVFLIVMAIPFLFLTADVEERSTADDRFAKAFHANPHAAVITRLSDGIFLDVNERWLAMFGYARDEVIGRTVVDLNIYVTLTDRAEMLARMARDGKVRDFECSARAKNGDVLHIGVSAEPIETAGDDCLIAIARDITELKRAEEANRNLSHASRLAVLGELTASIAHEINQPLGAILMNAEAAARLLESDSPSLEEVRNILADIRSDDVRASETIRHIRRLTRKNELLIDEPIDLNEVTVEVLDLVAPEARRRQVSLRTELTGAPAIILGDRVHLQQVLMNLILNGMDAMADTPGPQRRLLLRTRHNGNGRVEVTVTDSGRGIPAADLPRIFESFYTTKQNGVGLGLAIARSIVDAHGGAIFAENNDEGGATVRFNLPLGTRAAALG
jgi:PAS domain S-box-containing protein